MSNTWIYIEITDQIEDINGLVKNELLSLNIADHHLNNEKTYEIWISKLKKVFKV